MSLSKAERLIGQTNCYKHYSFTSPALQIRGVKLTFITSISNNSFSNPMKWVPINLPIEMINMNIHYIGYEKEIIKKA